MMEIKLCEKVLAPRAEVISQASRLIQDNEEWSRAITAGQSGRSSEADVSIAHEAWSTRNRHSGEAMRHLSVLTHLDPLTPR